MLLVILAPLLTVGALASLFAAPRRRLARILASASPLISLILLALPLPLPAEASLVWLPVSLAPEPLRFVLDDGGRALAFALLALLTALQWSRLDRPAARRSARTAAYLMTLAAIASFAAANPGALLLSWAWVDLLGFVLILMLRQSLPETAGEGAAPADIRPVAALALNSLGTLLVLVAFLPALTIQGAAPSNLSLASAPVLSQLALLAGIALRLGVFPPQLALPRFGFSEGGYDVLVRLVPAAAGLRLLGQVWSPQAAVALGAGWMGWIVAFMCLSAFLGGVRWMVRHSARSAQTTLLAALLALAGLAVLHGAPPEPVTRAAGLVLLLGGGLMLQYRGHSRWQKWSAVWPVACAAIIAGLPFTPGAALGGALYGALIASRAWGVLLTAGLLHIMLVGNLLRLAFQSGQELPAGEKLVWLAYYGALTLCLAALVAWPVLVFLGGPWRPGLTGGVAFAAIAAGGLALAGAARRLRQPGEQALATLESLTRFDWLPRGLSSIASGAAGAVRRIDSIMSGESAMMWSLGIAVLIWVLLHGS
ncbi:MAG: hypothetical protein NTY23_08980 [Chloroflexi bacterium]|nr:hypothetical protein [Chloroflexota bacterium]